MIADRVVSHYAGRETDLEELTLSAVAAAGKDPGRLDPDDLTAIDQFHIRGRAATLDLAHQLGLDPNTQVLDLGSGLGGASRLLAREFGCRVTGLDLCEEYCRVATSLTRRMELDIPISFRQGNALEMPFPDASFDLVWTQHTAMNIQDKQKLYREIWRVLKPGGKLAIYDILAGPGGAVLFPVPWAGDPSISFLSTTAQLRDILRETGFTTNSWRDVTAAGRTWFSKIQEKGRQNQLPALGLQLLLGDLYPEMMNNQLRNLNEDRIELLEAVMTRPLFDDRNTG